MLKITRLLLAKTQEKTVTALKRMVPHGPDVVIEAVGAHAACWLVTWVCTCHDIPAAAGMRGTGRFGCLGESLTRPQYAQRHACPDCCVRISASHSAGLCLYKKALEWGAVLAQALVRLIGLSNSLCSFCCKCELLLLSIYNSGL